MVNWDFWLIIGLAALSAYKVKLHWRYFALLNDREENDAMEYLKMTESQSLGSDAAKYLFFVLPIFQIEFLDTDDNLEALRVRKNIYKLLILWWILAILYVSIKIDF